MFGAAGVDEGALLHSLQAGNEQHTGSSQSHWLCLCSLTVSLFLDSVSGVQLGMFPFQDGSGLGPHEGEVEGGGSRSVAHPYPHLSIPVLKS